uniref:KIF-binding protein n=1 Tax=Amphora coffeiformis TaxID=265554 RepID=A0A7S3P3I8_9STRA
MFRSIVSTNFDAVALLRYGRFDESAFLLRTALAAIQQAGVHPMIPTPMSEGQSSGQVLSVSLEDCDKAVSYTYLSCFEVFNRAFILEDAESISDSEETFSLFASVCLYNMALAMHMKGLTQGCVGNVRKAVGLYQKVFSILSTLNPSPTHSSSSLLLATAMNIICCEAEIQGPAATKEWRDVFCDLFDWATQTEQQVAAIYNNPEESTMFSTCAVMYCKQTFSAAPAA